MRTLVCQHCGRQVLRNKKLKHLDQHYCGDKTCQTARKLSFEKKKYQTNALFRSDKLQCARDRKRKRAGQGNPQAGSRYQADYRSSHPGYVEKNRQKQRARNALKSGKNERERKIVNPDAIDQGGTMKYLWRKIAIDGAHHGQNRGYPGMVERVSAYSTRSGEKYGVVDAVNGTTSAGDIIEERRWVSHYRRDQALPFGAGTWTGIAAITGFRGRYGHGKDDDPSLQPS
jgi:hypothetical protein